MTIENKEPVSIKQAYLSMLSMIKYYWNITDYDDLTDILSGGEYWEKDSPSDTAFWEYWLDFIDKKNLLPQIHSNLYELKNTDIILNKKEGYEAVIYFLGMFFKSTKCDKISNILKLAEEDISNDYFIWKLWLKAIEKVKTNGSPPLKILH